MNGGMEPPVPHGDWPLDRPAEARSLTHRGQEQLQMRPFGCDSNQCDHPEVSPSSSLPQARALPSGAWVSIRRVPDGRELKRARDRLVELDRERATLLRTIAELRGDDGADITTGEGRVRLFASLFRGRPDVFATRWESTRTPGRSGWAPRCANEWQPGLCFKPNIKCAECANRRFMPLTHAEVRRHLEGRQTVGIYPLLADETCRLVAIDLDGIGWRDDVSALREAASDLEVPMSVERSRSG